MCMCKCDYLLCFVPDSSEFGTESGLGPFVLLVLLYVIDSP